MIISILPAAQGDLRKTKAYVVKNWGKAVWAQTEAEVFSAFDRVHANPAYGRVVSELAAINVLNYCQIFTSRHRIVYEPDNGNTFIHIVAGFKQDFQALLMQRKLG